MVQREPRARFSGTIEAIYSAAPEPDRWPIALEAVTDLFGDVGANLIYKRADGSVATIVSPSLRVAQKDYEGGWWKQDVRWTKAIDFAYRENEVITDRHLLTDEERRTHPFYTDFQRRHGLFWIVSMEISPEPFVTVALSLHRAPEKPAYSNAELALFAQVGRHAEQSLRLSVRLLRAELTNVGLGDAFSRLNIGIFVINESGKVIFSNPAALNAVGTEIQLIAERLVIRAPRERASLQSALEVAREGFDRHPFGRLAPIAVKRDENRHPFVLHVLPVCSSRHSTLEHFLGGASAVVIVHDPGSNEPLDPAVVAELLGLTPSEAKIASLVGSGMGPREAAEKLSISEETARTVLKRVFAKTGVARQSELAALMARLILP